MNYQIIALVLIGSFIFYKWIVPLIVPPLLLWVLQKKLSFLEHSVTNYLSDKEKMSKAIDALLALDTTNNPLAAKAQEMAAILLTKKNSSNKDVYKEVSELQKTILEVERIIGFSSKRHWPDSSIKKLDSIKGQARELRKKILD